LTIKANLKKYLGRWNGFFSHCEAVEFRKTARVWGGNKEEE
jgi:hypothetical protein